MTIGKTLFACLFFIAAILTGGYFLFRPQENRKADRAQIRERVTSAWNKSVAYLRNLWHTEKPEEIPAVAAAASR